MHNRTPRSTIIAERILIVLCLMTTAFFAGMALAPEPKFAACIEVPPKKLPLSMPKAAEKRWIAYWQRRGTM